MPDSESDIPDMISDGRRMRAVWQPGHGHGDSTQHIVDRCKTTIRGHPTWKMFIEDISQPIVRDSEQEPPHYVYLDDHACHTVWKSQQYSNAELKTYWPFDFDHQGNVKTGRPNRGRAAWTSSDKTEFAKGSLRGKDKWYKFTGEPQTTEYRPLRPATKTKIERLVEAEWAAQNGRRDADVNSDEGTLPTWTKDTSLTHNGVTPLQQPSPTHGETLTRSVSAQAPDSGSSPKVATTYTVQSSSVVEWPYHAKALLSPPGLQKLSKPSTPPPRYRSTGPFLISSSPPENSFNSPKHKRVKTIEHRSSAPGRLPECKDKEGQLQSNSLSGEMPELQPNIDSTSSSGEDGFLLCKSDIGFLS